MKSYVIAKCIVCGETRKIGPGEVPAGIEYLTPEEFLGGRAQPSAIGAPEGDPDWAGLDWDRLRSGNYRALYPEHQDVFDIFQKLNEA